MSEVLIFSDVHIYPHKRRNERLEDCLKTLDWVFETATKRKIKNILFGGDFFHDRQKIEVYTYQRAFEVLEKWLSKGQFNLYLLLGNHDLWFNEKTSISSVIPFSSLPGVRVVSQPERIEIEGANWDFIPFTHNPIVALEEFKNKPGKPQYALGHLAIDGAILHGSHESDVAIEHDGDMVTISPKLFSHYKHVYLGHYHAEQMVDSNLEYIGSPLELNFGEAFQEKHIIAFDPVTENKKYIKNDFSPKHLIISVKEQDKYDLTGNFVRLKVDDISATDLLTMKKDLMEKSNVGTLEIKQKKKKIDEHVIQDAKAILYKGDEMLSKYVEEVETKLDKNKLLSIGKKICQKQKT